VENALIREQFCRCGAGIANSVLGSHMGSKIILIKGNEDQIKKYLPSLFIRRSDLIGCFYSIESRERLD
jgi:alkylation response protein AidB-like acyl-CoA dehydrogenase